MLEILEFIFRSFWTFAGIVILIALVIVAPVSLMADAIVRAAKIKAKGRME